MGNCIYCGTKAGFFKSKHKECFNKYLSGKDQIEGLVTKTILHNDDLEIMTNSITNLAKDCFVKTIELNALVLRGYDHAVSVVCHDHLPITKEQESQLATFQNYFKYSQEQLNRNHSFDLVAKSSIIRRLADGEPVNLGGLERLSLPIVLQKGEEIVWVYANVKLYQTITRTQYVGQSSGVSIKLAKGVYYRTGSFKGHPISTQSMKEIASGLIFITSKNIYFSSPIKSIKIPYNKIISIFPYVDGVSIQKDGTSTKPFIFQGIDAWFIQNIVANINLNNS